MRIFVEKAREQRTKFAHFACITFAQYCKTKQASDIILEENDVVITEKSADAELFNNHFIQATNSVARINDSDYGLCVQVEKLLKGDRAVQLNSMVWDRLSWR